MWVDVVNNETDMVRNIDYQWGWKLISSRNHPAFH